eukprot:1161850-Pelagomonas_calceolata.AAC.3
MVGVPGMHSKCALDVSVHLMYSWHANLMPAEMMRPLTVLKYSHVSPVAYAAEAGHQLTGIRHVSESMP